MIQFTNLQFHYRKNQPLFQDFTLGLKQGSIYGLLGKNGSGKSTLLQNTVGALHPISGTCTINGLPTDRRSPSTLARVYYLPEQISFPQIKLSQFLKANAPFYPAFSERIFHEVLEEFDLSGVSGVTKLSHGQKRKVALAFAIATQTDWLLLDEPTNGLDIPSKSAFRKVVTQHLPENQGVIISTHQIADIEKIIERLIVIDQGSLLLENGLHELSEKLLFQATNEPWENQDNLLYSEAFGLGAKVIAKNNKRQEGLVDLELLFNALLSDSSSLLTNYIND